MPIMLTRKSPLSGKEHTIELPLSESEFSDAHYNWQGRRMLIQDAFPTLSAEQREFIMTGITPEEWNDAFAEAEEEDTDHGDGRGNFEAF